jgi:hypothetical protein
MARHLCPECLTIRALNLIHGSEDYDRALDQLIGSLEGRYDRTTDGTNYRAQWRLVTGSDDEIPFDTERRVVNNLVVRQLDRKERRLEAQRAENQRLYEASMREAS